MNFKQLVYNRYLQLVTEKIGLLQQTLDDLRQSAASETKSTAGDKHETALAMLQIEQENTARQLKEALDQQSLLAKTDISIRSLTAIKGSLVKTSRGYLFLSIALGKTIVENIPVIAISPQSPIGSQLIGARPGDTITVNNIAYHIEAVE